MKAKLRKPLSIVAVALTGIVLVLFVPGGIAIVAAMAITYWRKNKRKTVTQAEEA